MTRNPPNPAPESIALIGMACIFPDAPDLQAFWNNILDGVDAVGDPVPEWGAERYLADGRIKTPRGGWLKDLYRFDPREFGIMPNSVDGGEPDQYLALRIARDALADAGYLGAQVDHRDTGIILGHSTYLHRGQVTVIQHNIVLDQTMELLKAALPGLDAAAEAELRRSLLAKLPPHGADTAPGLVPNVMTGRIANRLNLKGPNYLVDAACSSSLLAVSAAVDELRAGRSRMMLAGGVNASLPADVSTIFTQLGALSARGRVRPFETGSDGTLLGEGLGMVVLKRLSDALADGDRIYAVLRGIGQASDGRGTGLLAPSVDGETLSIRRAYEHSGVDPATVGLIEAHGTGIPLGDKTEIAALANVFGPRRGAGGSIAIGSVKSMISHCIPAAGVAGLIKTALALHHRVLPPTLCEQVNPDLGLERTPLFVNTEARPWIAPLGQPRRAGVDSFGFGGINTHAIVEQAPASAARPLLLARWPFELCVLSAADAPSLAAAAETLAAALAREPRWALDEVAAALAAADRGGPARLAIVAKSREALAKGLAQALPKLRSAGDKAFATRGGVCYSPRPLDGKLAFLFPGEGSQYLGMFADLAPCFDELREWLDFWRGLYDDLPGDTRTDIVYPPASELTPERRKQLEARLHDMDVGSEAVMIGGQAMYSLLRALGVEPDVMLGHSSGESSALAASGALATDDRGLLASFIRDLNAVYAQVMAEGRIPTGALLAVGALPAAMVHETVAATGLAIDVAMDNCANQLVLYGTRDAIDTVQARLTAIGAICMPLPFDRGYHTPSFGAMSAAFAEHYKAIKLAAPRVPLYSCASAGLFPQTPAAVRKLAAAQWSQTVRFRETVQNMVADGVRCFVEVGPSGNLTAFVDDILADQPHLALASNQRRKHGLEQLLATLAQLWVHGRPMSLQALYTRRRIAVVDLTQPAPALRVAPLLANTMPVLHLDDADRALLRRVGGGVPAAPAPTAVEAAPQPMPAAATEAASDAVDDGEAAARAAVMADYFATMRAFLAQQQTLLEGWQSGAAAEAAPAEAGDPSAWAPFLDEIVESGATRLVARCRLGLHQDAFLRDHVLSGRGSDTDPELSGLACVPLMVSLEIMAEAAALLAGTTAFASIEQVRAFDWIALDDEALELDVVAEAVAGEPGLWRATLSQHGATAVTALLRQASQPRLAALPALAAPRAARWDGQAIYDVGMFHGPIFQSLAHVRGWDEGGIDCELTDCSLAGFFDGQTLPAMVLNPVLLDAMGQLAACWVAEHVGTDFNCFPSTIERIELLAEQPAAEAGLVLRGRQQPVDAAQAGDIAAARRWQFEACTADGRPLVRVDGLVNVFFHVPHRFYQLRRDPLGGWLGAPLAPAGGTRLWQLENLPEAFCAQSNAIFLRMLAHATLAWEERDAWRALPENPRQRRQWLLGRLALKELVRHWLHERSGQLVYPSDVVVGHDAQGAPFVDGWWVDELAPRPAVSLTHGARWNVAALREDGAAVGVDAEEIGRVQRPDLLEAAFTPAERAWLQAQPVASHGDALLRLWCAKEAAAKCLGTGLQGAPEAFAVTFESGVADRARVTRGDIMVPVLLQFVGNSVVAVAEYQ
ncbi:beta-ketoacyl synthase [Rubrivivax gelatinosus]|uniref:type I polyketide synthase n=1 Tax=Rubrivivax gelatinosus TaxID=28068 RepID=UPI0019057096|nr:type I polyketide synthase [Rubrivivax gelatinosus]MBK1615582.1 beta-ketoacyl synthase [Rubrivivax gelatinosus]